MARPSVGRQRASVVLVFGENLNDSESIRHLVEKAAPRLSGRVRARPRPVSLTRSAGVTVVRNWVNELSSVIASVEAAGQPVLAVIVHRDADRIDPNGEEESALAQQLAHLRVAFPTVPVVCTEAWWFQYPDSVESVKPIAWRNALPRSNRNVEAITDPKSELRRLTRRGGASEYSEADSPRIAEHIRTQSPTRYGTSSSLDRLFATATAIAGRLP